MKTPILKKYVRDKIPISGFGKDYSNLYMFGLFTYAPDRVQMRTEVLEEGIRDALSNYLDQINFRIQTINSLLSGRTSIKMIRKLLI